MPCKTKASPEEMLDQIASYLYQGVTITQAAENLHMSRITFRKWVLRYKEEGFKGLQAQAAFVLLLQSDEDPGRKGIS